MKKVVTNRGLIVLLATLFVFICLSTTVLAGDSYIETGKKYICEDVYSTMRIILVKSGPDAFGFVKVQFLDGYSKKNGSEGFVNLNNIIAAMKADF